MCPKLSLLLPLFVWLVRVSTWAKALRGIKVPGVSGLFRSFCIVNCHHGVSFRLHDSTGSLNVSVTFGFLNVMLWAGNAWCVYKETGSHSPSAPALPMAQEGPLLLLLEKSQGEKLWSKLVSAS